MRERWQPPHASGLLIRNPLLRKIVILRDLLLPKCSSPGKPPSNPQSAVFCLKGSMGDTVCALYVIRAFCDLHPKCEVHLVVPRIAKAVVRMESSVKTVLVLDAWRGPERGLQIKRLIRCCTDLLATVLALRRLKPEVAFDLYCYWPNSSVLLWLAGIKWRGGYESGGSGKLFTDRLPWQDRPMSAVFYMEAVVRQMGYQIAVSKKPLWKRRELSQPIQKSFKDAKAPNSSYLVVHPGTGNAIKEWPVDRWKLLLKLLLEHGENILITGAGARDAEICSELACSDERLINLCNLLKFDEFLTVLGNARLILGVDSLVGHAGAAVGSRTITLFSGHNRIEHWRPFGERATALIKAVDCYPCFLSSGCRDMTCIRQIKVEDVLQEIYK